MDLAKISNRKNHIMAIIHSADAHIQITQLTAATVNGVKNLKLFNQARIRLGNQLELQQPRHRKLCPERRATKVETAAINVVQSLDEFPDVLATKMHRMDMAQ
jgi:hypothetical protein